MKDLFGDEEKPERRARRGGRKRVDFKVPRPYQQANCRSCGEPIVFVRVAGRDAPMPLHVASAEERGGDVFMESHHAHCPQAEDWRRNSPRQNCQNKACAEKVPKTAPFCSSCWGRLTTAIRLQIREKYDPELESQGQAYWTAVGVAQRYLARGG